MKPTGDGRDEAFDRALGREFSRRAAAADACPQVELLSAWFDRALPATEAAAVEAHLASCGRCQEVLGHLARTEPEVLYVHPKPAATPWTWHLRWAVPVAAAAVIVFVVGTRSLIAPDTGLPPQGVPAAPVEQTAQNSDRALTTPAEAEARRAEPPVATAPIAGSAPTPAADSASKPKTRAQEPGPAATASGGNLAGAAARANLPGAPPATTGHVAGAPGSSGNAAAAPVASGNVAAPPAAIVEERQPRENAERPSASPARLQTTPSTVASRKEVAQPSKLVTQVAPLAGTAADLRKVESARADSALSLDEGIQLSGFVPGSPVGWRHVRPGQVLRTLDGGTSWSEQALPTPVRLLALSAVSPSVCWAAGAGGTVIRTIDGATWQAIKSPTTSDLVSIAALDDHRVTVRTSDGVSYDTGDAGATWRRR